MKPNDLEPCDDDHTPLPPKTTAQEDMVTAGQRKINLLWEYTQASIALFSTVVVGSLGSYLAIQGRTDDFPPFLALAYGLIMGCYFQRTNHTKIGGVGKDYTGR